MIAASFDTANRLFGLQFEELSEFPRYHPEVRAWSVRDRDGTEIGLFLGDYFARPSKRSGAWMSGFRSQEKLTGPVTPIIVNVMNFAKGGGRRAGAPVVRRRPHAVSTSSATPCTGSCPTSPTRCSPAPRWPATSWNCPRSSTSTGWSSPRCCGRTRSTTAPARRCRTTCCSACSPPAPSTRASPPSSTPPRRSSTSTCTCRARRGRARRARLRGREPAAHRHAGRDRHAPPHAALRPHLRRRGLRGGLLQLSLVGGAGRRRLRCVPGGRRHLRSGGPRRACATTSTPPATCATPAAPTRRSAAGCRASTRCCASAGSRPEQPEGR